MGKPSRFRTRSTSPGVGERHQSTVTLTANPLAEATRKTLPPGVRLVTGSSVARKWLGRWKTFFVILYR